MDEPLAKHDYARRAVDVMTAWSSEPDSYEFAMSRVLDYVSESDAAPAELISGFVSLAGWLLTKLEAETGTSYATTLQEFAAKLP